MCIRDSDQPDYDKDEDMLFNNRVVIRSDEDSMGQHLVRQYQTKLNRTKGKQREQSEERKAKC